MHVSGALSCHHRQLHAQSPTTNIAIDSTTCNYHYLRAQLLTISVSPALVCLIELSELLLLLPRLELLELLVLLLVLLFDADSTIIMVAAEGEVS